MSLLDEIKTLNQPQQRGCVVAEIIASLDKEDQAGLAAALDDPALTHKAIALALMNRGHNVNPEGKQVSRHRRGECSCRA